MSSVNVFFMIFGFWLNNGPVSGTIKVNLWNFFIINRYWLIFIYWSDRSKLRFNPEYKTKEHNSAQNTVIQPEAILEMQIVSGYFLFIRMYKCCLQRKLNAIKRQVQQNQSIQGNRAYTGKRGEYRKMDTADKRVWRKSKSSRANKLKAEKR